MELSPNLLWKLCSFTFGILTGISEVFYLCGWDTRDDRLRWVTNPIEMIEYTFIFMGPHPGYAWLQGVGRAFHLALAEARLPGSVISLREKFQGDSVWVPSPDPFRDVKSLGAIPTVRKEPNMHAYDTAHDLSLFARELGEVELLRILSMLTGLFEDIDELLNAKTLRDERRVQPRIE